MTRESRPETASPERRLSTYEMERFNESVLPYLDAAHNLARYLLRDPHEAEDAVQEAFLRAIRHFDSFRGVDGRAWLLSIVRNACFTQYRRRRSGGDAVEFDEEIHSAERDASEPEVHLAHTLAAESVREALDRLAFEFREVLALRELEGLSYKEIAQVAGVPIGTVMSRLARGRKQLLLALGAGAKETD
jgi:RNA polymerase sigma-70 factor (ECF subfamily)